MVTWNQLQNSLVVLHTQIDCVPEMDTVSWTVRKWCLKVPLEGPVALLRASRSCTSEWAQAWQCWGALTGQGSTPRSVSEGCVWGRGAPAHVLTTSNREHRRTHRKLFYVIGHVYTWFVVMVTGLYTSAQTHRIVCRFLYTNYRWLKVGGGGGKGKQKQESIG